MNTAYSVFIDAFLSRIERDMDFFSYFVMSEQEALDLAKERARIYLHEAFSRIMLECQPSVNFFDYSDASGTLNFEATGVEVLLVSMLMYESYLSRDIAKIKLRSVDYTSTDLRVFDPSNGRTSFLAIYEGVKKENAELIDMYKNTYRDTNKYIGIDYSSYDYDD